MSSIQTGIQLNDQFSSVMYDIIGAVQMACGGLDDLNQALNANVDTSGYDAIRESLNNATRGIDEMTQEQEEFNHKVQKGVNQTDQLTKTIKNAVGAYLSFKTVENVIGISDELANTTARLNLMNDQLQTTEELTNMIYSAAQDSRASFSDTANVVARLGMLANDAFDSSEQIVAFADQINKLMKMSGASTEEMNSTMLQLSQAMGSGVLRGDELNSILENGGALGGVIAEYMGVTTAELRELGSEGAITADIISNAILGATDATNAAFESLPMTWADIWQQMQNTALIAFRPVLNRINDIANSPMMQAFVNNVTNAMAIVAGIILNIFDLIGEVAQVVADNWSWISPIIMGVVAALGAYLAVATVVNTINGIMAIMEGVKAAAQMMATGATFAETVAQEGLNAALMACPITWIIMLIIALIAIIFAVANAIAKMTGIANTGFGVITGGIMVVIAFFQNLGLTVANIALGIGSAIAALASNMMTAFHNAIAGIQAWFYDLLSTALSVIAGICEALNNLPFVEFDYSGITSAASDYAARSAEASGSMEEYKDVVSAFQDGMSTFNAFQDGWASDAFNQGASWGDGVVDGISNAIDGFMNGMAVDIPNASDYTSGFDNAIANGINNSGLGDAANDIAGNTGSIKDSLDITSEDLKYLRDIAEQEAVNKFTTAEINIDYSGMTNNINNDMDIDGVVDHLTEATQEAIESITEGVHE